MVDTFFIRLANKELLFLFCQSVLPVFTSKTILRHNTTRKRKEHKYMANPAWFFIIRAPFLTNFVLNVSFNYSIFYFIFHSFLLTSQLKKIFMLRAVQRNFYFSTQRISEYYPVILPDLMALYSCLSRKVNPAYTSVVWVSMTSKIYLLKFGIIFRVILLRVYIICNSIDLPICWYYWEKNKAVCTPTMF